MAVSDAACLDPSASQLSSGSSSSSRGGSGQGLWANKLGPAACPSTCLLAGRVSALPGTPAVLHPLPSVPPPLSVRLSHCLG